MFLHIFFFWQVWPLFVKICPAGRPTSLGMLLEPRTGRPYRFVGGRHSLRVLLFLKDSQHSHINTPWMGAEHWLYVGKGSAFIMSSFSCRQKYFFMGTLRLFFLSYYSSYFLNAGHTNYHEFAANPAEQGKAVKVQAVFWIHLWRDNFFHLATHSSGKRILHHCCIWGCGSRSSAGHVYACTHTLPITTEPLFKKKRI